MQKREIHQQIQPDNQQHTTDHRPRQILRGIRIFFRKVDRLIPSVVGHNNARKHQNYRHDQAHQTHQMPNTGSHNDRRRYSLWMQQTSHSQRDKNDCSNRTRQLLNTAAHPQTKPLQRTEKNKQPERYPRLQRSVFRTEAGNQSRQVLRNCHNCVSNARAVDHPIGPAHRKAHCRSKGALRINVEPSCARQCGAEFRERNRPKQRINAANNPNRQDKPLTPQPAGNLPRQAQNPHAHRRAEDYRDSKAQPQNARKMPL